MDRILRTLGVLSGMRLFWLCVAFLGPLLIIAAPSARAQAVPMAGILFDTELHSAILERTMPYRVYLRLVVRDLSGNSSVAETSEPVLVDLKEPVARLVGIAGPPRHP